MSSDSKIEWTEATWNPVRGCVKVSPGCKHCYAETFAERFRGVAGHPYERGFDPRLAPDKLGDPLRWKKARKVFVNSMSDLFGDFVPFEYIAAVFGVMASTKRHTYQVLTKRAERMRQWFEKVGTGEMETAYGVLASDSPEIEECLTSAWARDAFGELPPLPNLPWPLPNVHLGVSVENKKHGVPRIEHLRNTLAAVRFLSIEPLLEDLGPLDLRGIHWVIVGSESGPGARPMHEDWVRSIRDQCVAAKVPFFYKQRLNEKNRKVSLPVLDGRQWAEYPKVSNA